MTKGTLTRTTASTTATAKPTTDSTSHRSTGQREIEQDHSTESLHQDISTESLHRDISLSVDQDEELDELADQRDEVLEHRQSLEQDLEMVRAAESDMKTELEQLEDLERQDPDAAARSRELLADEIRHDHIGESRAAITEAIRSADAEDEELDEAMQAVYAAASDGEGEPENAHEGNDGEGEPAGANNYEDGATSNHDGNYDENYNDNDQDYDYEAHDHEQDQRHEDESDQDDGSRSSSGGDHTSGADDDYDGRGEPRYISEGEY